MKWVDQTKTYTDKGYNNKTSLWTDAWAADQGPDGRYSASSTQHGASTSHLQVTHLQLRKKRAVSSK